MKKEHSFEMSFYHTKKNDKMLPFMSTEKDLFLCDIYILNQKRPNQYCATRSFKTFVMYSKKNSTTRYFPSPQRYASRLVVSGKYIFHSHTVSWKTGCNVLYLCEYNYSKTSFFVNCKL